MSSNGEASFISELAKPRLPPGRIAIALFALAASASGCTRAHSPAAVGEVVVSVRPTPAVTGPVEVSVSIADPPGTPLAGANVTVEGNMTHPGMKPELGTAREVEPGKYIADLTFTMMGDWILFVTAELPDGRRLSHRHALPAVGRGRP